MTSDPQLRAIRPVYRCECGDHAFVALTKGFVALCSPDQAHIVGRYNWAAYPKHRSTVYAKRVQETRGRKRTLAMHSLLIEGEGQIDHINGNGIDNRRSNLRRCDNRQNQHNCKPRGKSQFKGVQQKTQGSWAAKIVVDGKKRYIGSYPTDAEAARAYDAEAVKAFGEFARTNQMMGLFND